MRVRFPNPSILFTLCVALAGGQAVLTFALKMVAILFVVGLGGSVIVSSGAST